MVLKVKIRLQLTHILHPNNSSTDEIVNSEQTLAVTSKIVLLTCVSCSPYMTVDLDINFIVFIARFNHCIVI